MTQETQPLVAVDQADRDAAADLFAHTGGTATGCDMIRKGEADRAPAVQAFARHRLTHPHPGTPAMTDVTLREALTHIAQHSDCALAQYHAREALRTPSAQTVGEDVRQQIGALIREEGKRWGSAKVESACEVAAANVDQYLASAQPADRAGEDRYSIDEREDDMLIAERHWQFGWWCIARRPKLMTNDQWRPIAERIVKALAALPPAATQGEGE